jgi:Fe-S-cluster containining protein
MQCQRCGACCQVDFSALVLPEDRQRWLAEGRQDILCRLAGGAPVWCGDRLVWPADGREAGACRFLRRTGPLATCRIHATRPSVCRSFTPGPSPLCPQWAPS